MSTGKTHWMNPRPSCPQQGLYFAFMKQCHSLFFVSSLHMTNITGKPDVPSCSQLHVILEVMDWDRRVALGCLTAQHRCLFLPSTASAYVRHWRNLTTYTTCSEFSRNGLVCTVINKLVLTTYKKYFVAWRKKTAGASCIRQPKTCVDLSPNRSLDCTCVGKGAAIMCPTGVLIMVITLITRKGLIVRTSTTSTG